MNVTHMKWGIVIALAMCVLASCSPSEETSYSFTTSVEEGIEIVVTSGGPKYPGELFTYEEILRLKEDPEIEESVLFRPGSISRDEAGFFYVLDTGDNRIAVFNPAGQYIRSFGRKGQGPGEFSRIASSLLWSEIVSVFDSSLYRTTRFRTVGSLLDVTTIPPTLLNVYQGPVEEMHLLEDGAMLFIQLVMNLELGSNFLQRRVMAVSQEQDTLWVVDSPVVQTSLQIPMSSGGMLSFGYPFAGSPEILYHPEHGIVVSDGIEPELRWYDSTGRLTRKVRVELEPVPLTSEDMTKLRTRMEGPLQSAREEGRTRTIDVYEAQLKALEMPDHRAVWRDMILSDEGYLWLWVVEHSVDRDALGGGYLFRVLSPEGEYLGDTRVPYGLRFTLSDDRLMTTWYPPESDEYQMLICRIMPAVPGLTYPN